MCGGRGQEDTVPPIWYIRCNLCNIQYAKGSSWRRLLDLVMGMFQAFQHGSRSLDLTVFGRCKHNRCIQLNGQAKRRLKLVIQVPRLHDEDSVGAGNDHSPD